MRFEKYSGKKMDKCSEVVWRVLLRVQLDYGSRGSI